MSTKFLLDLITICVDNSVKKSVLQKINVDSFVDMWMKRPVFKTSVNMINPHEVVHMA